MSIRFKKKIKTSKWRMHYFVWNLYKSELTLFGAYIKLSKIYLDIYEGGGSEKKKELKKERMREMEMVAWKSVSGRGNSCIGGWWAQLNANGKNNWNESQYHPWLLHTISSRFHRAHIKFHATKTKTRKNKQINKNYVIWKQSLVMNVGFSISLSSRIRLYVQCTQYLYCNGHQW